MIFLFPPPYFVQFKVTDEDIGALKNAALASKEQSAFMILGHIHLARRELHKAMLSYIQSQHHANYTPVLEAVKELSQFRNCLSHPARTTSKSSYFHVFILYNKVKIEKIDVISWMLLKMKMNKDE